MEELSIAAVGYVTSQCAADTRVCVFELQIGEQRSLIFCTKTHRRIQGGPGVPVTPPFVSLF